MKNTEDYYFDPTQLSQVEESQLEELPFCECACPWPDSCDCQTLEAKQNLMSPDHFHFCSNRNSSRNCQSRFYGSCLGQSDDPMGKHECRICLGLGNKSKRADLIIDTGDGEEVLEDEDEDEDEDEVSPRSTNSPRINDGNIVSAPSVDPIMPIEIYQQIK